MLPSIWVWSMWRTDLGQVRAGEWWLVTRAPMQWQCGRVVVGDPGLEYVVYGRESGGGGDPVAAAPARSTGWKVELLEEEPVGRWQEKTEQHAPPNPAPWRPARPARLLGGGDGGHGCLSAWSQGETRRRPKRRTRFFPCLCPCAPRRCKFSSFSIWLVDC